MGFFEAVRVALIQKFATFKGRARRSEYWYFQLFATIVWFFGFLIAQMTGHSAVAFPVAYILILVLILPNLAVTVRRLHDTDRSGWLYLVAFVPVVGNIVVLVWVCSRGTEGVNRYGSDPLSSV
ncbi:conserved hypothetical protein; putative inner membrane protein [Burkholderia sp. 8Y]|uniref:DUF805 domain-containing protein n=1 Tax=Burkholderia sp. 8Y TaxID=2653133 RepID=UPI0012F142EF|nr:DUF805 domain-containing protein [Burkholderia sp. 8Y]VXB53639.1 conserved hypothetical protein; putative inner membrane protein [Burkholderia sp. 8Y]